MFYRSKFSTALRRNQNSSPLARSYGGTPAPVKGKCILGIKQTANRKIDAEFFFFFVEAPNAKALIGLQTCQNLELMNINQVNLQGNAKCTIQPPRKVPAAKTKRNT